MTRFNKFTTNNTNKIKKMSKLFCSINTVLLSNKNRIKKYTAWVWECSYELLNEGIMN